MLNESVHDNAALKFVFLAGGPGSGKNYVASQLFGIEANRSFSASGMKLVSFDAIFEKLLEKHGYPTDLSQLSEEERKKVMNESDPKSLYQVGRRLVKKQMKMYMYQGLGIIFDGTGQFVGSYLNKKELAEELGYDTHLLFVETPLKTALKRNAARSRKLPEDVVAKLYRAVKRNKDEFHRIFGDNMIVVDNSDGSELTNNLHNAIDRIVAAPVKNPLGQEFLQSGGIRKPKEKPKHMADKLPPPLWSHPQKDGSHKTYTDKGVTQKELFPGEKEKIAKEKENTTDSGKSWKDKSLAWWERFKLKQQEKMHKQKETPHGNSASTVPTQQRIHNPETGNDILVTTALGYPPGHPMRTAAEKYLKK